MAYFCLTVLQDSAARAANDDKRKRQKAVDYYRIERGVLDKVGELSSEKGGDEARKAEGRGDSFTSDEICFLKAVVIAFIRRATEKAADPNRALPCITLAKLPKQAGLATR